MARVQGLEKRSPTPGTTSKGTHLLRVALQGEATIFREIETYIAEREKELDMGRSKKAPRRRGQGPSLFKVG